MDICHINWLAGFLPSAVSCGSTKRSTKKNQKIHIFDPIHCCIFLSFEMIQQTRQKAHLLENLATNLLVSHLHSLCFKKKHTPGDSIRDLFVP